MQTSQLDFYFPFILFFYGLFVLFMMDSPALQAAREKLQSYAGRHGNNAVFGHFFQHRASKGFLYFMTLFSGLWAAQNLYFS